MRTGQPVGVETMVLCKGRERYAFVWTDENLAEVLRQFGRWASDPELSFTWYDAAVLSKKVRERGQETT